MTGAADPRLRLEDLLHFTDQRNLPKIVDSGGLLPTALLRKAGIQFIPGGDDASLELDGRTRMDRFVHLCFRGAHPMAHRVVERDPTVTLKYLRIDRSVVFEPGVLFVSGVGYAHGVNPIPVAEACARGLVDFDVLYKWMDWRDPAIQERRRAAELCEILVPDRVALSFIKNLPNG
jgi:hypothetical protein